MSDLGVYLYGPSGVPVSAGRGLPLPDPAPPPAASCLDTSSGPLIELFGSYTANFTQNGGWVSGTRVDASAATFIMPAPGANQPADPFTVRSVDNLCLSGGVYSPGIADDEPDWEKYHSSQGIYLQYGLAPHIENVAIIESGDGIRFSEGTDGWTLRNSYVQHAGDDTIENDFLYSGTIDDVLIDWAYAFISCRLDKAQRGAGYPPGGTVVVENSLVAMRPQVGAYGYNNHGGQIFKWEKYDKPGCKLKLRNNVFMVTDGEFANLRLDPSDDPDVDYETLIESSGNTIVWLGVGDYPEAIPAGFTLTTDVSVWEAARTDWFDRHPRFEEFR